MKLTIELDRQKITVDNPNIEPVEAQLDVNQLEPLWEALKDKLRLDLQHQDQ